MRAAPVGAYFVSRRVEMERFVEASTRLTHTDPRALTGAMAVALVTALSIERASGSRPSLQEVLELLATAGPKDEEWKSWLARIREAHEAGKSVERFAADAGLERGVTGYVYHTVPVAVYAWLRHFGDFRRTVVAAVGCGGDSDTVGAIAGALAGAAVGESGIPKQWVERIVDWPRSPSVLRKVALRLAEAEVGPASRRPVSYAWPALPVRNLAFLAIVLLHGLRRLAPPY